MNADETRLADALDHYLDAEPRESLPVEIPAAERAELEALLRTAGQVRDVMRPGLSAAAAQRQERLLFERADQIWGAPTATVQPTPISIAAVQSTRRAPFWRLGALPATVAAAVTVVLLLVGGSLTTTAGSLPSSPLYPLKLASERVQVALSINQESRARVYLLLAERRLGEAEQLATAGRADSVSQTEALLAEARGSITLALVIAQELRGPSAVAVLSELSAVVARDGALLEGLLANVPAPQRPQVVQALDTVRRDQETVRQALEQRQRENPEIPNPIPTTLPVVAPPSSTPLALAPPTRTPTEIPSPTAVLEARQELIAVDIPLPTDGAAAFAFDPPVVLPATATVVPPTLPPSPSPTAPATGTPTSTAPPTETPPPPPDEVERRVLPTEPPAPDPTPIPPPAQTPMPARAPLPDQAATAAETARSEDNSAPDEPKRQVGQSGPSDDSPSQGDGNAHGNGDNDDNGGGSDPGQGSRDDPGWGGDDDEDDADDPPAGIDNGNDNQGGGGGGGDDNEADDEHDNQDAIDNEDEGGSGDDNDDGSGGDNEDDEGGSSDDDDDSGGDNDSGGGGGSDNDD